MTINNSQSSTSSDDSHEAHPSGGRDVPSPVPHFDNRKLPYWALLIACALLLVLCQLQVGSAVFTPLWFPAIGLGLVLTAWYNWRGLIVFAVCSVVIRWVNPASGNYIVPIWTIGVVFPLELLAGWWCYYCLGKGSLRLNDPWSATSYLLVVPGLAALIAALIGGFFLELDKYWSAVGYLWIGHALGLLTIGPTLLAWVTPFLADNVWPPDPQHNQQGWLDPFERISWGDIIEIAGFGAGAVILGLLLTRSHIQQQANNWQLWAMLLILTVWASLRQGLRGGTIAATGAALAALVLARTIDPALPSIYSLQGNLLALSCVALLVGASSGWIRASEMRYRQVVGHIPVVLYSARFLESEKTAKVPRANIMLVSAACREIFGCPPADLLGSLESWLDRIHPDDRELVIAAISQLARQHQAITCEYRLNPVFLPAVFESEPHLIIHTPLPFPLHTSERDAIRTDRWVRETLAPRYLGDQLEGWEGVIEDITTKRILANDLKRTSTMFHSLVANLPAGVYFVQGSKGLPILLNNRARQLLGQREDPSVGITHLSRVYRLHKPDGSVYPWEELPVYKALHLGLTTMKDDIVVHRADGRQIPLITWAAPISLSHSSKVDAAVWVFEDLTALHQAEAARLDTENQLRTIIETMAEGLIIQDHRGVIIDCNPAAAKILGLSSNLLIDRSSFLPEKGCLQEDGLPLDAGRYPDQVCLKTKNAVRNVVIGVPMKSAKENGNYDTALAFRWILVSSVPMTTGQTGKAGFLQRVITTFADISSSREVLVRVE